MPLAIDLSTFATDGYVIVTWDSTGLDPDFYAWRIYRRIVGDPTWTLSYQTSEALTEYELHDPFAAAQYPQEWALTQVTVANPGDPQVESPYEVVSGTPQSDDYWLIHPTDDAFSTRLYHVTSHSNSDNYEQATIPLIDRGYHTEQGSNFGETGSLSASMKDRVGITARQQRQKVEMLKASQSEVWLRTPFGDMTQVTMGQLSFEREGGVGLSEHGTLTIPYTEVK